MVGMNGHMSYHLNLNITIGVPQGVLVFGGHVFPSQNTS